MMPKRAQTPAEEMANAASHALGVAFCLIAMPIALMKTQAKGQFWAVMAFAIGMLLVYTSSTLYHWLRDHERKLLFKKLDHISIYFLIAGTYTPFFSQYLPAPSARPLLTILWLMVVMGTLFKLRFIGRFKWVSVSLYLLMGWMALFVIGQLAANMPAQVLWLGLGGGLSYTLGVAFYLNSQRPFFHAIWHGFVLLGTALHYAAVFLSL